MADFETNDVIALSARMLHGGQNAIVNRWHVYLVAGGPVSFANITTAIQNYLDTLYGYLEDYITDEQLPDSIGVSNATQDTVFGSIDWGSWAGGLNTQDPLPLGVCCMAYARTLTPRVQLRKYFGAFTEQYQADGAWTSALVAACVTAMSYHIGTQTPDTGIQFQGIAYNYSTQTGTEGFSTAASTEPAYQRRRRRGRGS